MYTPMHPHTSRNTHPPVGQQPFPALQPTTPTRPPNTHHEEEPPTPTQQPTTLTTTHIRARHVWGRGHNTRSNGIKERVGGSCSARQRKDYTTPVGAASCNREQHTMASCQKPPHPTHDVDCPHMGAVWAWNAPSGQKRGRANDPASHVALPDTKIWCSVSVSAHHDSIALHCWGHGT